MTLKQRLMEIVGKPEVPESWIRNIQYADECFPEGKIHLLSDEYLVRIRERIILSEDNARIIADTMSWIKGNADLSKLFWLWHCTLFRLRNNGGEDVSLWPTPIDLTGTEHRSAVFPAIVLLSGYEQLIEFYEQRNIPEPVIIDTLSGVEVCMDLFKEWTGRSGLGTLYMNWLLHHFHGKLYKLGRLEYEIRTMDKQVRVYRNVQDGRTITFSEPGITYRKDGLVNGTNRLFDDAGSWISTWIETEDYIAGHPIAADGCMNRVAISINKQEWELVLAPDDAVLSVHIPRQGKLTQELCNDSFSQAVSFFAAHFPERGFRAFFCGSWLLDPQLGLLLNESSNLIRFQRRFNLFPISGSDDGLYRFVFNGERCDTELLPEGTSLQKKLKRFMASGGKMNNTGGYILI